MARSSGADRSLTGAQRYSLISQTIDGILGVVKVGFICVVLLGVAYWTREVLLAYAGKSTLADIAIGSRPTSKLIGRLPISLGLAEFLMA